jgi:hypothetical protein
LASERRILAYFERHAVESGDADVWAEGADATLDWIELMRVGASQQQVDALLKRVRAGTATMFFELCFQVERWAQGAGFRVS